MNKEVYKIGEGISEVTLIHKKGQDHKDPDNISVTGNIDSVFNYLEKTIPAMIEDQKMIIQEDSIIVINREIMHMDLRANASNPYQDIEIKGKLELHPDFSMWKINTGESWEHKQLSEFIKMNRSCFSDRATAMKLSSELANVKIKAESAIEKSDNNRGNFRVLAAQEVIESNVPAEFKLNIPVFKGQPKVEIEIEVYVNPSSYSVTLVSPEANDIIADVRDNIIDEQKKKIQELAPGIVIIEQ